eukprot:TRINITY_DN9115_c0_g1_i1.p1 TRINITY_DN9115_c0_g1~~TRINITY_DN9115_c0_g1_i1.p1  ORF type:complete len:256 (+),score=50.27 TRINITY_DN9115_c0_g1_i1:40-768(+)
MVEASMADIDESATKSFLAKAHLQFEERKENKVLAKIKDMVQGKWRKNHNDSDDSDSQMGIRRRFKRLNSKYASGFTGNLSGNANDYDEDEDEAAFLEKSRSKLQRSMFLERTSTGLKGLEETLNSQPSAVPSPTPTPPLPSGRVTPTSGRSTPLQRSNSFLHRTDLLAPVAVSNSVESVGRRSDQSVKTSMAFQTVETQKDAAEPSDNPLPMTIAPSAQPLKRRSSVLLSALSSFPTRQKK